MKRKYIVPTTEIVALDDALMLTTLSKGDSTTTGDAQSKGIPEDFLYDEEDGLWD